MGHKNIGIVTGWVCRHLLRIRDDDFSLYSIDYWAMHGLMLLCSFYCGIMTFPFCRSGFARK